MRRRESQAPATVHDKYPSNSAELRQWIAYSVNLNSFRILIIRTNALCRFLRLPSEREIAVAI
jgi:hypothetical protein